MGNPSRKASILRNCLCDYQEVAMLLKWAAIFFVIALVAAAFGFSGIAVGAASIAKTLFFLFLAIFAVLLIAGLIVGHKALS
jgi:uncharacterized membrane protein YtjA (UPF0391 family)